MAGPLFVPAQSGPHPIPAPNPASKKKKSKPSNLPGARTHSPFTLTSAAQARVYIDCRKIISPPSRGAAKAVR